MNMMIGYILTMFGISGTVFSYLTITNDRGYSYTAPFTNHEMTMMAIMIISFIVLVSGIMTIIFSAVKSKNEAKLKEIENLQGKTQFRNKCPKCNINVSGDCFICPNCGQKLK
jgi:NhaP-type Na+/H+ or K+/H+ antiporter